MFVYQTSPSFRDKSAEELYAINENERKKKYNQQVIQVDKGAFTSLVFNTNGGMGPEATKYHKRVAGKISSKRNENYSDVMRHIRPR